MLLLLLPSHLRRNKQGRPNESLLMCSQGTVRFHGLGEAVGAVAFVGGGVVGFEGQGDPRAPAAFCVAGVEEDAVGGSGEDWGLG